LVGELALTIVLAIRQLIASRPLNRQSSIESPIVNSNRQPSIDNPSIFNRHSAL